MLIAFSGTSILRAAALCLTLTTLAVAGPPLICHPFDIGDAKTLPWGTGGWDRPDPSYDRGRLVADTLNLLTPQTPVLVRMETLRRAALYAGENERLGYELLAKLLARAANGDSLSRFDAGYLVETSKQAAHSRKHVVGLELDGYSWVVKSIEGSPQRAEMEFAASLMGKKFPNDHSRRAQSAAGSNALLAKNLKNFGL